MDVIEFYKNKIEKVASDEVNSPKDKFKNIGKKVLRSAAEAKTNGYAQEAMSNGGAVLGTALAMKKGNKSLAKAIATGGLAGMAAGDIAGSIIIPTTQLQRQHKKEFGEKADLKSKAMIMGANVLPTAALWGVALGNKKIRTGLQKGISDVPRNIKRISVSQKAAIRDGRKVNELLDAGKLNEAKKLANLMEKKAPIRAERVKKYSKAIGGATAALGAGSAIAEVPTYIVTPRNVIDAKKKEIDKLSKNKQGE